jgi:DNA-binding GntR family transcriptional regulator
MNEQGDLMLKIIDEGIISREPGRGAYVRRPVYMH